MVASLRSLRLSSTVVTAVVAVVVVVLLSLSNINVNNRLLQPQSVFAQVQQQQQEEEAFLTYENPDHGIFIQYPSDWTGSTSGLADYTEIIAFYSPLENPSQFFPARFSISVERYAQNVSLQEYTEFVLAGLQNQSEVDVKNSLEVTVAGYPGYRLVLEDTPFQNNTLIVNSMPTWAAVGNKLYLLEYSGEQSSFNQYLPEVNQMLESLVIEQTEPS